MPVLACTYIQSKSGDLMTPDPALSLAKVLEHDETPHAYSGNLVKIGAAANIFFPTSSECLLVCTLDKIMHRVQSFTLSIFSRLSLISPNPSTQDAIVFVRP